MRIKTKRWNDPIEPDDGFRLLVCRYRPRGVRKEDGTWHAWQPNLGPSRALHADFYGKNGPPIAWTEFTTRYLREIEGQARTLDDLAHRAERGEIITLLCSSACTNEKRCHRSLLRERIERTARNLVRAKSSAKKKS